MNTVVQAIQWLLDLRPMLLAQLGTGQGFFSTLSKHNLNHVKHLAKDMLWRMLISGWAEHRRQHDVSEFFAFLCQRHHVQLVQGQWQARRYMDGVTSINDTGSSTQPLLLSLPPTPPGLSPNLQVQSLIDYWSGTQAAFHAYTAPPLVLAVQLERYTVQSGRVHKRKDKVIVNQRIAVPRFEDEGLDIRIVFYDLFAVISHHGNHPRTGHYTATLLRGEAVWSCDDHRRAISVNGLSHCADECYLLLYVRSHQDAIGCHA